MLQRARWALDEEELKTLQARAAYYGLDKAKSLTEYRINYLKATQGDVILKYNLQMFAEDNLSKENEAQLKKGIRTLTKRIEQHKKYIENPLSHVVSWESYPKNIQAGTIRHWEKEIKNFEESIQARKDELERRG